MAASFGRAGAGAGPAAGTGMPSLTGGGAGAGACAKTGKDIEVTRAATIENRFMCSSCGTHGNDCSHQQRTSLA
ncbi:MAG: hypothetical protein DI536_20710 [Archangium gephyra]|uniref:Uncharacterized protein n=1 Tax=Archangium gephyra TaxID=48 RepID=A0A2W5TFP5_9BACT|nr:MAG: hypothetical protein DI536_20710 [Archangium gephyra]